LIMASPSVSADFRDFGVFRGSKQPHVFCVFCGFHMKAASRLMR